MLKILRGRLRSILARTPVNSANQNMSHMPIKWRRSFFLKNLMLLLIPLMIPLVILGSMSIVITQRYIKDDINKNNQNVLTQMKENVELLLSEVDSLSLNFKDNSNVVVRLKALLGSTTMTREDLSSLNLIKSYLSSSAYGKPYIHSIYVYYENEREQFLSSSDGIVPISDFYDSSWYEDYQNKDDHTSMWTELRGITRYDFETNPTPVITIYKRLSPLNGVLVLNIRADFFQSSLNDISGYTNRKLVVLDESNRMIISNYPDQMSLPLSIEQLMHSTEEVVRLKQAGKAYVVSRLSSFKYDWTFLSIMEQRDIYQ
ncbi:MAG: cache domain-containing protein, partial [Gorillibacterium sp.]|nr:cache domain-containing protein [Gorillibacterium sp.]